jgi:hypothetical protein
MQPPDHVEYRLPRQVGISCEPAVSGRNRPSGWGRRSVIRTAFHGFAGSVRLAEHNLHVDEEYKKWLPMERKR